MNISGLLEKLMRRENLSVDEAAEAMGAIMSGDATPAQIGALLVGLTMKGERPAEIVGLAKTMRANAVQLSRTVRRCVRHVRNRRRPLRHVQHLVGGCSGGRGRGIARGEARQPIGLEPVRQRGCVRGAGRQCGGRAGSRRAIARERRHRVLLCADVPSVDAARRAGQARARRPHRVQSARAAHEPRRHDTAARGRSALGADRADCARAAAAGVGSRVGRARRRRDRRDVDDRPHEGVRVPERRGIDVLRAPVGLRHSESRAQRSAGRRRRPPTPRFFGRCSPDARARAATSCCSTPAHRCSSAERRHRCAKESSAPRRPSIPAPPVRSSTP